uniref:ANK_REP_REGION domain-containing protein n=1 Tax=Macrostomum lignano TaxID=282301 RepID=A0A1I8IUH7_9PLAT
MSHLKPLDDDDKLYFDLFTLLPLTLPPDVPHDRKSQAPDANELAGLYCSVAAALRALQAADEVDGEGALMRQLESWYECSWCHCAVRCLAVMAQLKYRNKTAAKETLSELVRDQVMSSGWTVEDLSKEAISETQSWRWPLSTDWAWRFCLPCDRRPSLPFLPRFTESLLTARLCSRSPMQRHLYLNFRCLSWSLQAELLGGRRAACIRADDGAAGSGFAKRLAQQWFRELQAESAGSQLDTEELATLAHYTDSPVQLRFCLERMEAVVARGPRVAMDSCDNERLERVSRKRALRIVDQADCNNGDQLDDETMLKRHCDILDSLVDATKDILNYQATISEHHCQCVLMALLNITRHSVGNRCCQNAVVKYAATCDREEAQQRESNSATANGLDCSTALPPMPDAIRRELPDRREECYIRLADAAGSFAVSVQDSSAAESSWKVQGHCLKKLAKSNYRLQAACRRRAIEQAARDGRVEVLDRYMRKVPAMDRSFLCTCLIEELALSGKVDALRTLAMAMRETDSRNWCCFRMAANAALAGRLEASVLLLQSITFGEKLRKKCCKRLVLIAEEQHQLEELFRLLKNTSVSTSRATPGACRVLERINCLWMLAEAAAKNGFLAHLPDVAAAVASLTFKSGIVVLLIQKSAAPTEQRLRTAMKILPQIKDAAERSHLFQILVRCAARFGSCVLIEETLSLLPSESEDGDSTAEPSHRDELLSAAAEAAAGEGKLETAIWAAEAIDSESEAHLCLAAAAEAAQMSNRLDEAVSLARLIKDASVRKSAQVRAYRRCLPEQQVAELSETVVNHGCFLADNCITNSSLLALVAATVAMGDQFYLQKILLNANQHQLHQLLCSSLSNGHSALATAILPSIQDVNKRLDDQLCSTTLMLAAELGHCHVIAKLLERGADRAARDTQGCTALDRARLCGRNQAAWVLAEEGNVELTSPASTGDIDLHDSQLSEKLHWALTSSGFTQSRAACQQRLADLLERTAACLSLSKPRLIGSFADGWGCSLTRLNARLSDGSGIDWLTPVTAAAGCPGATKLRLDFTGDPPDKEEGAQLLTVEDDASGFGQQPRVASAPCGVKPATSTTLAFRSPQSASILLLPLVSIRDAALIHLQQTFAIEEKQRMRQLNTVQGQLFILLKFLLKNYLAEVSQCPGLTSHHVKHLLFYLIETHGSWNWQMWQPHKLIELAKEALDLMMKFLDSTSSSDDGCMPSFFKPHVQLQLQWTGRPADEAKTRIRAELLKARSDLDPAVKKLMSHLKPLDDDDKLYFDLFTLLPLTLPPDVPHDRKSQAPDANELAGLYCSVAAALRALQAADEVDGEGALMRQLESWYECSWCHCAVRCLAVMAQLKYRNKTAAKETLSELVMSSGWTVEDLSKEAISETQSWRWPLSTDWAWRFCLPCDRRPSLPFLPRFTESLLTARLCSRSPMQRHLYVNFRCLSWSLQAELLGGRRAACIRADGAAGSGFAKRLAQQWFLELQAESAGSQLDTEELATLAHYTDSPVQLRFCLERMEAVVAREPRVAMDSCDNERLERMPNEVTRAQRPSWIRRITHEMFCSSHEFPTLEVKGDATLASASLSDIPACAVFKAPQSLAPSPHMATVHSTSWDFCTGENLAKTAPHTASRGISWEKCCRTACQLAPLIAR